MLPQPIGPTPSDGAGDDARTIVLDDIDRRAATLRALRHAGALFAQGLVLIALLSLFFVRLPQVDGHSMAPQIDDGEHVVINTLAYGLRIERPGGGPRPLVDVQLRPVERGDVIAFVHGSGDDRRIYLKRVIGLPGETVGISRGVVTIGGGPLAQTYGADPDSTDMAPLTIPPGSYFVLGDNRGDSDDSRSFGSIAGAAIIGRAALVVWPPSSVRAIR